MQSRLFLNNYEKTLMSEENLRINIRSQRESLGWSAGELASKIGVNPQSIYDIESGKVQIKVGVLFKLKEAMPHLETGLESLDVSAPKNFLDAESKEVREASSFYQENILNKENILIAEYDVMLSAGHGAYPAEDHALEIGSRPFSLSWIEKKGLSVSHLKLVRVKGYSMEPVLRDKDIVMIDTSKTTPTESMPFVVRFGDDLLVKTIQRLGDGSIALVSQNKSYNDIIIDKNNPPEEFQIIGAVVWHAHSWI